MEKSAQDRLRDARQAAELAAKTIATNLIPLVLAFKEFAKQIRASLWYAYIMDGAPYGETTRGLERWTLETSIRMRTESKAEIDQQWQELLVRARGWYKSG